VNYPPCLLLRPFSFFHRRQIQFSTGSSSFCTQTPRGLFFLYSFTGSLSSSIIRVLLRPIFPHVAATQPNSDPLRIFHPSSILPTVFSFYVLPCAHKFPPLSLPSAGPLNDSSARSGLLGRRASCFFPFPSLSAPTTTTFFARRRLSRLPHRILSHIPRPFLPHSRTPFCPATLSCFVPFLQAFLFIIFFSHESRY